jgi:hypothetical protein
MAIAGAGYGGFGKLIAIPFTIPMCFGAVRFTAGGGGSESSVDLDVEVLSAVLVLLLPVPVIVGWSE